MPVRRAEPNPLRSSRRTERWLREADVPLVLVGNTVWRIKRRPVWNVVGGGRRRFISRRCWPGDPRSGWLAQDRARLKSPANPLPGSDIGVRRCSNRPWNKTGWTERRPGWKPTLLAGRAARAGSEGGTENAGIPKIKRFHRSGRLNATQPGVIAVSTPYIRGLGALCKPSVARGQQSPLFRES